MKKNIIKLCMVIISIFFLGCEGTVFSTQDLSGASNGLYHAKENIITEENHTEDNRNKVHTRIPSENESNMVLTNNNFLSSAGR
jgi:hypothetical protein